MTTEAGDARKILIEQGVHPALVFAYESAIRADERARLAKPDEAEREATIERMAEAIVGYAETSAYVMRPSKPSDALRLARAAYEAMEAP